MAITSTGLNAALVNETKKTATVEDRRELNKDDFLKLLLVELQHQDPTEPMDSDKILSQTSQLATLESAKNTNDSLDALAKSLKTTQQFSTISAIGKMADIGSDTIGHDEGSVSSFELYFSDEISSGNIEILDNDGEVVSTIDLEAKPSGVHKFDWDGKLSNGDMAQSAMYHIRANYNNPNGDSLNTKMGSYPIESVKFDNGNTLVKLGSSYIPLNNVKEIY